MRSVTLIVVSILALAPAVAPAQELVDVRVINFPDVFEVGGGVRLTEPAPHGEMVRILDVVVSQAPREATTRLIPAGTVDTAGFTRMVLSLGAEMKGTVPSATTIGALLVPDEQLAEDALDDGQLLFPVEVEIPVAAESQPFVASRSVVAEVAFPRYRVLLYNNGTRTATASLYVHLTN